jgi:hypothetical protein
LCGAPTLFVYLFVCLFTPQSLSLPKPSWSASNCCNWAGWLKHEWRPSAKAWATGAELNPSNPASVGRMKEVSFSSSFSSSPPSLPLLFSTFHVVRQSRRVRPQLISSSGSGSWFLLLLLLADLRELSKVKNGGP